MTCFTHCKRCATWEIHCFSVILLHPHETETQIPWPKIALIGQAWPSKVRATHWLSCRHRIWLRKNECPGAGGVTISDRFDRFPTHMYRFRENARAFSFRSMGVCFAPAGVEWFIFQLTVVDEHPHFSFLYILNVSKSNVWFLRNISLPWDILWM
jgi:hypothetical protein